MCPSPWRVPEQSDFDTLLSTTDVYDLIWAWGHGGSAKPSGVDAVNDAFYYWSKTKVTEEGNNVYYLFHYYSNSGVYFQGSFHGYQVRCVK